MTLVQMTKEAEEAKEAKEEKEAKQTAGVLFLYGGCKTPDS